MTLIHLLIGCIAIWQSGAFYTAYRINQIEARPTNTLLIWSVGLFLLGSYFLISMIGSIK